MDEQLPPRVVQPHTPGPKFPEQAALEPDVRPEEPKPKRSKWPPRALTYVRVATTSRAGVEYTSIKVQAGFTPSLEPIRNPARATRRAWSQFRFGGPVSGRQWRRIRRALKQLKRAWDAGDPKGAAWQRFQDALVGFS